MAGSRDGGRSASVLPFPSAHKDISRSLHSRSVADLPVLRAPSLSLAASSDEAMRESANGINRLDRARARCTDDPLAGHRPSRQPNAAGQASRDDKGPPSAAPSLEVPAGRFDAGPRRRAGTRRLVLASIVSLVLHVVPVACFVLAPRSLIPGAGGAQLDAIGIDMVPEAALESMILEAQPKRLAGAAEPIETSPGLEVPQPPVESPSAAPPPPAAEPPKAPPPEPSRSLLLSDATPPPLPELKAAELQTAEPRHDPRSIPPEPLPELPPDAPEEKVKEVERREPKAELPKVIARLPEDAEGKDRAHSAPIVVPPSGGSSSRSATPGEDSEGAAGASPGELARFGLSVRLALGKARPRHAGMRGRVVIVFALGQGGEVVSAMVAKKSGNPALDDAALAAVNRASFPPPPTTMSEKQRTYSVPFEFR